MMATAIPAVLVWLFFMCSAYDVYGSVQVFLACIFVVNDEKVGACRQIFAVSSAIAVVAEGEFFLF